MYKHLQIDTHVYKHIEIYANLTKIHDYNKYAHIYIEKYTQIQQIISK